MDDCKVTEFGQYTDTTLVISSFHIEGYLYSSFLYYKDSFLDLMVYGKGPLPRESEEGYLIYFMKEYNRRFCEFPQ